MQLPLPIPDVASTTKSWWGKRWRNWSLSLNFWSVFDGLFVFRKRPFFLILDPWSLILDPWSLILDPWSLILDPWSLKKEKRKTNTNLQMRKTEEARKNMLLCFAWWTCILHRKCISCTVCILQSWLFLDAHVFSRMKDRLSARSGTHSHKWTWKESVLFAVIVK
jgi:hypothetical protein